MTKNQIKSLEKKMDNLGVVGIFTNRFKNPKQDDILSIYQHQIFVLYDSIQIFESWLMDMHYAKIYHNHNTSHFIQLFGKAFRDEKHLSVKLTLRIISFLYPSLSETIIKYNKKHKTNFIKIS